MKMQEQWKVSETYIQVASTLNMSVLWETFPVILEGFVIVILKAIGVEINWVLSCLAVAVLIGIVGDTWERE